MRPTRSFQLLRGMRDAMKVSGPSEMPTKWKAVRERIGIVGDLEKRRLLDELSIKFHDELAVDRLRHLALNRRRDTTARQYAVEILADAIRQNRDDFESRFKKTKRPRRS